MSETKIHHRLQSELIQLAKRETGEKITQLLDLADHRLRAANTLRLEKELKWLHRSVIAIGILALATLVMLV